VVEEDQVQLEEVEEEQEVIEIHLVLNHQVVVEVQKQN